MLKSSEEKAMIKINSQPNSDSGDSIFSPESDTPFFFAFNCYLQVDR